MRSRPELVVVFVYPTHQVRSALTPSPLGFFQNDGMGAHRGPRSHCVRARLNGISTKPPASISAYPEAVVLHQAASSPASYCDGTRPPASSVRRSGTGRSSAMAARARRSLPCGSTSTSASARSAARMASLAALRAESARIFAPMILPPQMTSRFLVLMVGDCSGPCGHWQCRVVNRYVGNLPPMPGVFPRLSRTGRAQRGHRT